jgi:indole-3-glycerol phosphate synthase
MAPTVPDILAKIVSRKHSELAGARARTDELERLALQRIHGRRDFRAALAASKPAVISEIKKASPSKGLLAADFNPASTAASYERGGAAALSVLTDEKFFQGSLADLEAARGAVALPVLRKDFTLDEFHIVEAAAHGADAVLLIVAILEPRTLRRLRECAAQWNLSALIEVHDGDELAAAIDCGADIIGVNNRNLHTFEVTLETSIRLAEKIPASAIKVSESGIHSAADVRRLSACGFQAFLVGEHLMKSGDPEQALKDLRA